jgi:sulfite oxidase
VPELGEDHSIEINGLVGAPRNYSVADLKRAFPTRTVISALQCAGNRRADYQPIRATSGNTWHIGAIGNAEWTGVALADVLAALGVGPSTSFVAFTGADAVTVDDEKAPFGVSIPFAKALEPDVLLAWEMNGAALAPEHGAPLRVVVPGYAGVRSTKWLTRIELRDRPSDAPIQARDYKLFPAAVSKEDANWDDGLTINEMPINAAICTPAEGDVLSSGLETLRGYAIAHGRAIARVEVSVNGGIDWLQATLDRDARAPHAWTQWHLQADLSAGLHVLVVRAVDEAGQGQPERPGSIWNFPGYLSTAWHRVTVTVA